MRRFVLLFAMGALSVFAADITGRWTGTMQPANDNEPRPAYLILKQSGTTVTGTAGPEAGEQYPIIDGKLDGDRLTFQVDSKSMKFELRVNADEITGEVTREHDGEVQKAKLAARRQGS